MSRYKILIAGLLVVALAIVVYTFTPQKNQKSSAGTTAQQSEEKQSKKHVKEQALESQSKAKKKNHQDSRSQKKEATVPSAVSVDAKAVKEEEAKKSAVEKAVNAWEKMIDDMAASTTAPVSGQADRVKEAFDQLDPADQLDAVHRAVNLLPDSQFSSLLGILYDKKENSEVLDIIFSDALNRSEDIKLPMMKELIKDNQHPMYFESARILDATGELDKMSGKKQADSDGTTEIPTDN